MSLSGAKPAGSESAQSTDKVVSLAAKRPLATSGTTNVIVASTGNPSKPAQVTFERRELNAILRIYSFMVAAGHWRDYAIDHLKDRAIFSVYRKASEQALYRIEKDPKLANRQGAYAVFSEKGIILKRGHDLTQVLRVFDRKLKLVE